jgi:MFS transporter, PAT family, beta-lactamase induction signal transducer AmpG
MALSDTGTDGLAVEATPEHERALVQGVMVGARAAGLLLSLLCGGWLANRLGWPAVFAMVALLGLPGIVLSLRFWQRKGERPAGGFSWRAFRGLARREVLALALMGVIYVLALDGVLSFLSFHPDAKLLGDIGTVSSLVAVSMVGRMLGAAVSGRLTDRFGYRRSMQVAIALSALACLGMSLTLGPLVLALVCLVFGFAYGYYTTTYSAVAMTLTDPHIAASMFAIFMMFLNIGIGLGQGLGGVMTDALGFQGLAWTMALVSLLNLLFVRRMPA